MMASEDTMADPYPVWNQLLEQGVHRTDTMTFFARYADAKRVMQETGSGRYTDQFNTSRAFIDYRATLSGDQTAKFDEFYGFVNDFVVRQPDPESHDRLRRIVHRAFTPRRIERLRQVTEGYTDELLDEIAAQGRADLMDLAYQLPLRVIIDLLGCPAEDRELIHGWSMAIANQLDRLDTTALTAAVEAIREFRAYVEDLVDSRRGRVVGNDFIGTLLDAEQDERLTTDELTAQMVVLLFAGHETTSSLIGNGLNELLRHPDEWRAVCRDPDLVPNAVEELLRWVTPVQWITRVVASPHAFLGHDIPEGHIVVAVLAAANRDPAVFTEPQRLDVRRADARQQISFGYGPKFCLGAALARMEAVIVLGALARRFPAMELVETDLDWTSHPMMRRLVRLPVALTGAGSA